MSVTWVSAGTFASGTIGATPGLPAGWQENDIFLLFMETMNGGAAQVPAGWTAVDNSPQKTTGDGTNASKTSLEVFWRRATTSESAPAVGDTGNHVGARIHAFRGCATTGNPWDVTNGGINNTTTNTGGTASGVTTTVDDCLVVVAFSSNYDPLSSTTTEFSSWTNASLTSLTERSDNGFTAGNGGVFGVATGGKTTAGATGNTTVSFAGTGTYAWLTIALKPQPAGGGGGGGGTLVEDASTPAVVHTDGTTPISTASFTPPNGSLVVAMVSGGWGNSASTVTVKDSSSATNWSGFSNPDTIVDSQSFYGIAGVFYKYFAASPGAITVTGTFTNLSNGEMLAVKVLTGADPTNPIGNTAAQDFGATTGTFSLNLTPTVSGSRVYGAANFNDTADTAVTPNANTSTIQYYYSAGNGTAMWTFQGASATDGSTTTTYAGTVDAGQESGGAMQLVEILPLVNTGLTASAGDSEGLTDGLSTAMSMSFSKGDSEGLTDSPSFASTHSVSRTDSEGLTDSLSIAQTESNSLGDSQGLTDVLTVSITQGTQPSDSEGITDSTTTKQTFSVTASDTAGLTDSQSFSQNTPSSFSESIGLTDTASVGILVTQSKSDPLGLTDSVSVVLSPTETKTDSLGMTDSLATVETIRPSVSDSEGLTDSLTTVETYRITFTDSLGLTDNMSLNTPNGEFKSDIIGLSDSLTTELIMPHSSPGFGEIAVDRFYVIEREVAKEGNDGKLSISGQESSPPTTVALCTFIHGQISGMEEGRLIPVVFRDKAERDGYYVVGSSSSALTDYQSEVATVDWEIELIRQGSDTEVDIQSRLTGAVRNNDFSLTGQRWHAPAQVHYGYYTGTTNPTVVSRTSSYGTMKVYLDVPANTAPKWGCPVANYKGGRVKLLDTLEVTTENEIEGVNRRLSTGGWALDNGMIKVEPSATAGVLVISVFSGGSWRTKNVDIKVNGSNVPAWSSASLLRNDLEQVVLRLVSQPDPNSAGRATLDLTLRRGSRFVEGYLQHNSSTTLAVQARTAESSQSDQSASGYVTSTVNDANGNRFACGSARSFTKPTNGGVQKTSTTTLDWWWGSVVGGGSAATGDTAVDLRNQYIGAMTELTYAVRR